MIVHLAECMKLFHTNFTTSMIKQETEWRNLAVHSEHVGSFTSLGSEGKTTAHATIRLPTYVLLPCRMYAQVRKMQSACLREHGQNPLMTTSHDIQVVPLEHRVHDRTLDKPLPIRAMVDPQITPGLECGGRIRQCRTAF